jgi:hypothetical protein
MRSISENGESVVKLSELTRMLVRVNAEHRRHDPEVEIWLPGSTIRLTFNPNGMLARDGKLLIEGNVNPGSALLLDEGEFEDDRALDWNAVRNVVRR